MKPAGNGRYLQRRPSEELGGRPASKQARPKSPERPENVTFVSAIDRRWRGRENAIRQTARHLSFRRAGRNIQAAFKSVINGLRRQSSLEADGEWIRKK